MVRLHAEYYGRGPTRSKVYANGEFLAVVLEETFTPAEKIPAEARTDMSDFEELSGEAG
jgi:uncharacterized protein YbcI